MGRRYFTPRLFDFLDELTVNNNREWFKQNQPTYEQYVREPALDFITDFAQPLNSISPHFIADSRKSGGSLFRMQRDTRFSPDKTPYKINTGMHFRHQAGRDVHAPGFYMHLQSDECFMGIGLWRPETKVAYAIRSHIDAQPEAWIEATQKKSFAEVFQLGGDSLVRPPKGFAPDHPLITDLKRKDFMASTQMDQKAITSNRFLEYFTDLCKQGAPMMRFLCEAVGVPF